MTRLPERLRARLEREGKRNDRSMNAEITHRLEESLAEQDALGGPDLQRIALMMATSFHHAGDMLSKGKPPAEWLRDPECYREAAFAVMNALILSMPNTDKDIKILVDTLPSKIFLSLLLLHGSTKHPELFARLSEFMESKPPKEIPKEVFEELKSSLERASLEVNFRWPEGKTSESE